MTPSALAVQRETVWPRMTLSDALVFTIMYEL